MEAKEESSFVCDVCGKVIANKCNLKRHKLMHSGFNESVKCGICQKTLSSEGNLKRHMRIHVGVLDRQECGACGKTFSNVGNLRRHLRTHQAPGVQFECKLCKKCFPFEDYLKKHVRTVHGCNDVKRKAGSSLPHIESFITREDGHKEEETDQSAPQSISRSKEDEVVHSGNNGTDGISNCEEPSALLDTVKVEAQDTQSQNTTQESDKPPSNSVSTSETPEVNGPGEELREKLCPTDQCNICRQVLTDPAQVKLNVWRMHLDMRIVKKEPSEKFSFEYNCSVCGKYLSNKGNLKRHMLLLHKKDLTGSDVDANIEQIRAECHICGRMVANKGNLKRHMEKVHVVKRVTTTGENPTTGIDENKAQENSPGTQFYPTDQPDLIKVSTESASNEKTEPAAKKRRSSKQVSANGVTDNCIEQKNSLKVRLKTTNIIPNNSLAAKESFCISQPCTDPACQEANNEKGSAVPQPSVSTPVVGTPESKEHVDNVVTDNSTDVKGSNRWRSRSFDDVYAMQPNASVKNGLCQSQCEDMFSCPMCKRRFLCEDNFKKHMKRHRSSKPQKPPDNRMTLEGINEVAPSTLMCHLCGQVMPFPASLQHHLQVVHGNTTGTPQTFPSTATCYPKPPNEFANWSYPPILTRFSRRDGGAEENCESVFAPKTGSVGIQNAVTTGAHETLPAPSATFSAPTTPLRKFVYESRPSSACAALDGGSPASSTNSMESDCANHQKDNQMDQKVLVIMQPRCM